MVFLPPENAVPPLGKKRPVEGKYRDVVTVQFGEFDLSVLAPNEAPPLGRIELFSPDGRIEGPLDSETWKRLGVYVRTQRNGTNGR